MKYKRIAFLFPGQGAQYPGMGKDFAQRYPIAKQTFEEAGDILHRNISAIAWDGSVEELTETRNSQTAIFVNSMAILRVLENLFPNLQPAFSAGLSLGEYSALVAAKKLSFQECLQLVEKRGEYMQAACLLSPGTMAVVMGLEGDQVEEILAKMQLPNQIWAANFNCPGQVVISGTIFGVTQASEQLKLKGAKRVVPLQVAGAFHSGLMQTAEERLKGDIEALHFKSTPIELVMNYSGSVVSEQNELKRQLIKQVTNPVKWERGIHTMSQTGVDLFLEIGCGKTLAGMNKRIGITATTRSIEKIEELDPFAKEIE